VSNVRSRTRPKVGGPGAPPLKVVGSPPRDALKEVHLWADYVELRCLVAPDRALTRGDLVAILRLDPEDSPESEDPDEDVSQQSDVEQIADASGSGDNNNSAAARAVDNRHRLANEVFDLIETRYLLYADTYPFDVSGEEIRRLDNLDDVQRTYLFLLSCASGRYVSQHGLLAKSFERLCARVLEMSVPGASVHVFGTAQGNNSMFSGNFVARARSLASQLGEVMQPDAEKIARSENGDRGLDVVAFVNPGDDLSSRLVIFAQAATGREWHVKQHSVTSAAWDQIVQVRSPAVATCLIPLCFRDVAGDWHDASLIHRSWLLDRFRILRQAKKATELGEQIGWEDENATKILEGILDYTFTE
jgi:hypothetical protein